MIGTALAKIEGGEVVISNDNIMAKVVDNSSDNIMAKVVDSSSALHLMEPLRPITSCP